MSTEKEFVLKPFEVVSCETVRLTKDARKIINIMQADSGMSATKIVSKCVKFAFEHYEGGGNDA